MFHQPQKTDSQAEINAATLRTLVDLRNLCDGESKLLIARRPFRLNTQFGAWTGAILPGVTGALAVQSQQLNGDVLSTNTRAGRDLSWSLKQVGIYTRGKVRNLSEFYESLRAEEFFEHNGWRYDATPIGKLVRALGAPDPCFELGHFTYHQAIGDVENAQVLAFSGQVARTPWRAYVLPFVDRLQFLSNGEMSLGEEE